VKGATQLVAEIGSRLAYLSGEEHRPLLTIIVILMLVVIVVVVVMMKLHSTSNNNNISHILNIFGLPV